MSRKKSTIIIISVIAAISVGVLAYNGWYGGGSSIPEDTFTRGLVGYWSFDEGGGTTAYNAAGTGSVNDGALTNGPKYTRGKKAGALEFDGRDDYVNCSSDDSLDITDAITIEAWIKPATLTNFHIILGKFDGTDSFYLRHDTNQVKWTARDEGSGGMISAFSPSSITSANTWYHILATFDGSEMLAYVNGIAGTPVSGLTGIRDSSSTPVYIGGASGLPQYFNGAIDEVRIYDRALSAEEVRYHYNRGAPVAHWSFDEGQGTTTWDGTENNNDGTLGDGSCQPGTSTCPSWVSGKYGSALNFDGSDDYVNMGDQSSLEGMSAITIEAWIKPTSLSFPNSGAIVNKYWDGTDRSYHYFITKSGQLAFRLPTDTDNDNDTAYSSSTMSVNQWYHVVGTWDSADDIIRIYINSEADNTKAQPGNSVRTNSSPVWIGRDYYDNVPRDEFFGTIDDVRIYDYARTADEIRLDYNAGYAARFGGLGAVDCSRDPASCMSKGLVGYWGFDEGSGTTAYNAASTGSVNDGALINGPNWTRGKKAGALSFDGRNDYVDCDNNSSLNITAEITVEAWVKPDTDKCNVFVHKYAGENQGWALYAPSDSDGLRFMVTIDGSENAGCYAKGIVLDNSWHHIVGTYDGTDIRMYVDGVLKDTANDAGAMTNGDTNTKIGDNAGMTYYLCPESYYFNGAIDEVRIYNRALSAEEVRYHYNRGAPVAEWSFDEGSGTTTYDGAGEADGVFPSASANQPEWVSP